MGATNLLSKKRNFKDQSFLINYQEVQAPIDFSTAMSRPPFEDLCRTLEKILWQLNIPEVCSKLPYRFTQ